MRYGAKALPEGGWHTHPAAVRRRRADRRRRRRISELDAAQGHSPGDAHRHARRRDGVRRASARATRRPRALKRYKTPIDASAVRRELYPVRNVHQAFGYGLLAGARVSRACRSSPAAGGSRIRCPAHAGHERMQKLADYYGDATPGLRRRRSNAATIDRKLTFDKAHQRALLRHAARRGSAVAPLVHDTTSAARAAARSTATRACGSVPANVYEMVDDGDGAQAAADQRVELRALQDLRHHGSVPDHRLGPARRRRRAAVRRDVDVPDVGESVRRS